MPTLRSRRQASASRICEGSLYIDLRLRRAIPARWPPPCAAPSSSTFQDRFGACRVRLPLFASEKPCVLSATPSAPGPGMCWLSAGSVRHTSSVAPGGAPAGCVSTPDCCGKPVTWNMYMLAAKNSSLACAVCAASTVVLMHPPGGVHLLAGAQHARACRDPLPVRGTRGRADTPRWGPPSRARGHGRQKRRARVPAAASAATAHSLAFCPVLRGRCGCGPSSLLLGDIAIVGKGLTLVWIRHIGSGYGEQAGFRT